MALATAIAAVVDAVGDGRRRAGDCGRAPRRRRGRVVRRGRSGDGRRQVGRLHGGGDRTPVFYRGDRIVMRPTTAMSDGAVKDGREQRPERHLRRPRRATWATTVERIEFPQPRRVRAIKPVLSVSLSAALRWGAARRRGAGSRAFATNPASRRRPTTASGHRRRTASSGPRASHDRSPVSPRRARTS